MMTDPIADFFVRIKNAQAVKSEKIDVPASRIKTELARCLKEQGFIQNYKLISDRKQGILRVYMKYVSKRPALTGFKRVSRPGRRTYRPKGEIPRPRGGLGIAIVSTSQGLKTDAECRQGNLGGEVFCIVW